MIIVPPTITPRRRFELASFLIESIESAGVHVPTTSRLRRMYDALHSGKNTIAPDDSEYETALEAERDLQLLGFVFDQCPAKETSNAFRERLNKLINDSPLPQMDHEKSHGRDAAFELYVGAVCRAAQLHPVEWGEPDVTCVLNGVKYAFEAKRLKNLKNMNDRVRKAVEQIDRSRLPGVIVLDLSLALNPANHRLRQMPDSIFWPDYKRNFDVTWSRYQPKVQQLLARANVLGVVAHDYHLRRQPEGWQLTGITIRVPAENRTREERRQFDAISVAYTYALPNQSDGSELPLVVP
jgi:hypothetical protein